MTTYFYDSAGSNTAPYDTEAKAATTWATLQAVPVVAGDIVKGNTTSVETAGAAKAQTFPATPGLQWLSVTFNGAGTGALTAGAQVTTTGNFAVTFVSGCAYTYGVIFSSGTGASASADLIVGASNSMINVFFDVCTFNCPSTSTSTPFTFGSAGGTQAGRDMTFKDCVWGFGAKTLTTALIFCVGRYRFYGNTFTGNAPTSLLGGAASTNAAADIIFEACDLSAVACTNLVNVGTWDGAIVTFINCKLNFTNVVTGTFTSVGTVVRMHNCDNASGVNYRFAEHSYFGDVIQTTAITKTAGATVDAVAYAWKMTASANTTFWAPLKSPPIDILNTTTGSGKTATLDIVIDSATTLNDNDTWIEVEYLADSADPLGAIVTDRMAGILSTPAAQDSSSPASWSGVGGSATFYRLRTPSFTPQNKGYISARVCLAKASAVIYVDPVLVIA